MTIRHVRTQVLDMAFEEHGPAGGSVVILLHGFPYDPRCFDEVAPPLAAAGYRVVVPYLRGYGPTRFLSTATMRSGQQAAIGKDVLELMNALNIDKAVLMGFDWGGRAACIMAALWPERVSGLVTALGYLIQDIPAAAAPLSPDAEARLWYQYYFHGPRGRAALIQNRYELCKYLWRLWSPTWHFTGEIFQRTASSFGNPDFVDVVVHSYKHRFGYEDGDPAYADIETALTRQPVITVPTIALSGAADGVHPHASPDAHQFTNRYQHRTLPNIGHNIPQEAPGETVRAVLELLSQ
jgi:pimeloyl-ACP methyl ester carboxylesterase